MGPLRPAQSRHQFYQPQHPGYNRRGPVNPVESPNETPPDQMGGAAASASAGVPGGAYSGLMGGQPGGPAPGSFGGNPWQGGMMLRNQHQQFPQMPQRPMPFGGGNPFQAPQNPMSQGNQPQGGFGGGQFSGWGGGIRRQPGSFGGGSFGQQQQPMQPPPQMMNTQY